jgi:non-specific serine/threonine protein kinase
LTLLGPGGTGKTRIALQLAAECLHDFTDGVFFVALDPVRDTEHVAMAIASALGLKEGGGSQVRGAVDDFLASRNLLLVLDNFEQVVEAGPLVSDLLRRAPALKVVVTSRESLRITGEKVVPIAPLELPSLEHMPSLDQLVQFEAVRLFIDRATLVNADFMVTNENAPAVAQICHRLDGLPLAIELAASRVRLFEPETLLLRLDRGLGTMLTGGSRGLSARRASAASPRT